MRKAAEARAATTAEEEARIGREKAAQAEKLRLANEEYEQKKQEQEAAAAAAAAQA